MDVLHPAVLVSVRGTVVVVSVEVVGLSVDVVSVAVDVGVVGLATVVSVGTGWGFTDNFVGMLLGLAGRVGVWSVYNDYFLGDHHLVVVVISDVVVNGRVMVMVTGVGRLRSGLTTTDRDGSWMGRTGSWLAEHNCLLVFTMGVTAGVGVAI